MCRAELTCRVFPTDPCGVPDDAVFLALAHPVRRRLLQILVGGPRTAGDLAQQFDLSRPAVAEHLQVLRRAALVRDEPVGRQRRYHLTAEPLAEAEDRLAPVAHARRAPLRRAGPVGRQRRYPLTAEPLAEVEDWLHPFEHFWRARLRSLADVAEEDTGPEQIGRG